MTDRHISDDVRDVLVDIRDLSLEFRLGRGHKNTLRALDGIDLKVHAGEVVSLVGESGSGKTTLGKTILGLYRPTGGELEIAAARREAGSRKVYGDLQMIFQDPLSSFNPRFTIASSIALPLRLNGTGDRAAIDETIGRLLSRVGLTPAHGQRYPHELSGGQLQRAAIARVLGLSPRLIVADEAVSKLDVSVRAQILNLIKSINRQSRIAIIFITHDLSVARFLSDRIVVMYFGRVVEEGTTREIFERPRHPYTFALLNTRSNNVSIPTDDMQPHREGCNFAGRCPRALPRCRAERPAMTTHSPDHRFACFNPVEESGSVDKARSLNRG